MKPVSNEFKQAIKQYGRQIKAEITYSDGEEHLLNSDVLFSVTPTINGNILKSVMKQVDFESSVKVPKNTIINVKFGVKVGEDYEYVNFGNYIVSEEPEYNADTQTYSHVCYDKLLYSMKDYQRLDIDYPIEIRDYIRKIAQHLGLTFKNTTDTFANYDKQIKLDLYDGQGYTFRDVLDELAEVTASTICINEITDELEIRYLNDTQEIINEDYFKNINVEFAQMYGPINSIVLSRSGESDNVYLQNETSVQLNGLCELKIIDNQIMNDNDRSVFLADILDKLNGITYYINNFDSPGITWLELCDKYTVQIGTNQYNCVLFNDEIKITQGLEETIFTELPVASETDYTKADKTDRKINQTYLIVDKQNQKIESVISQTDAQNQKISVVEQTVNELNSKISDIADITTSKESTNAKVEFEKINQSEPIYVRIYATGVNISYLYPHTNLFPSETLYPKVRTLRFTNTTTNEYFDYELPTDLLYYDAENYDEFILDYDAQKCEVNKRVGYNADGTTYVLENPKTIEYEYPRIELTDGDYTIELLGYHNAYIFVRLMAQNMYTTQWATKAELNSEISQTTSEINLSVDKKLTSYPTTTQMNAAISVKANEISSTVATNYATKNELTTAKSEIKQTTDSISSTVSKKVGEDEIISKINQSAEAVGINANKIELSANDVLNLLAGNTINLSGKQIKISSDNFTVDENGNLWANLATLNNATINNGKINIKTNNGATDAFNVINENNQNEKARVRPTRIETYGANGYTYIIAAGETSDSSGLICSDNNGYATFKPGLIKNEPIYNNTSSSSANLIIDSAGQFRRSTNTSSKRYKTEITEEFIEELNPERLYNLPIKQFRYKEKYQPNQNDVRYNKDLIGFIAEEIAEIYPIAVDYENGQIETWNERYMIPAMLNLIQKQHKDIQQLQNEINQLKKENE